METLTGFKWIARVPGLVFGYEEALGYCVDAGRGQGQGRHHRRAAAVQLVAALKAQRRTVHDVLDDLARRFGLHATDQLSVRVSDLALIADAMARLRAAPPTSLAGADVLRLSTTSSGVRGTAPDRRPALHASPTGCAWSCAPAGPSRS